MKPADEIPPVPPYPSRDEKFNDVIVVIPAYREDLVIGSIVLKARRFIDRVIVVDDGSSDRTSEVATYAGAQVITLDKNHGKAHALLLGLNHARELGCTAVVMIDGDGQHMTREIPDVVTPVLEGRADLVIGSRFLSKENDVPTIRRVGQKILDKFSHIGSGQKITDSQSGFRALSKKALDNLDFPSSGYNIESDMIVHFSSLGLKIVEVPISVRYDVPKKPKQNPFAHGFAVLANIINLISYQRPLLAFGVPGFIIFILGVIASSFAFTDYYVTARFPFTLSMVAVSFLILGMLLIIAGLILNALVSIIHKNGKSQTAEK